VFIGLVVCAFLLGAAWPVLSSLASVPPQILTSDVYALTQGSGAPSINDSLVQNLSAQPWVDLVEGEILAAGTLGGAPVVVRGANTSVFVAMEGGTWLAQTSAPVHWAVAGSGLQARAALVLGQYVTLEGSSNPRLDLVPVVGFFRSSTVANDELVVDVGTARFLTGTPAGRYHSIRVKTSDPAALSSYLRSVGASVWISGSQGFIRGVDTQTGLDPRLVNVLLRQGTGVLPPDYLSQALGEATDSVRVVAAGLGVLIALLVTLGVYALQARAFEDRRAVVGVLRALGARGGWMRGRALLEILPLALLAGVVGGGLGLLLDEAVSPMIPPLAFGHAIRVAFDPLTFGLLLIVVAATASASQLLLLQRALKERPAESLRTKPTEGRPVSLEVVLRD